MLGKLRESNFSITNWKGKTSAPRTWGRGWFRFMLASWFLTSGILLTGCDDETILRYTDQRKITTGYYRLRATHHMFPRHGGNGGGIAYINGEWLIVSGEGAFQLFKRNEAGDDFRLRQLPYRVPMNRQQFNASAFVDQKPKKATSERFRVADVVLKQFEGRVRLWVSHHWWSEKDACFVLRVSTAITDVDAFLKAELPGLDWETLYETTPCLRVWGSTFAGHEAGGKMAISGSPPDALYLTVGTHGFNGLNSSTAYSQEPDAAWGKVIKIDLDSGVASVFTSGHRNAQGLFLDQLGQLWLAEHGPRGGDELNLLKQGKNYGWPLVTYGTDYGTFDPWPLTRQPGRHNDYEQPIFAWVPSIGVSDLIRLEGDLFPLWKGDIIAGSLREASLYRLHIREGRVIVVERIEISKRIRDMAEGPNGEIVLWTDNFRIIFVEPIPNAEFPD